METMIEAPMNTCEPVRATSDAIPSPSRALTPPSAELAERFMRKVTWDERLTVYVYHPAPGAKSEWITEVGHLYNFLLGPADMFILDPRELQKWVDAVLGDTELALEIGALLGRLPEDDENDISNRVWLEPDPERQAVARSAANAQIQQLAAVRAQIRQGATRLLGERIAQCVAALEIAQDRDHREDPI